MVCPKCGLNNENDAKYCKSCGTNLNEATIDYNYLIQDDKTPISVGGYIGYSLLFSIPFIGFILLIVFAITSKNVNLRNYARAMLLLYVIVVVLLVFLMMAGGMLGTVLGRI